jgi:hypothetical protein
MKTWIILTALAVVVISTSGEANAGCTPAPQTGCKLTTGHHETWMTYLETGKTDPDDVYTWAWHGGDETTLADLEDPTATTYAFCVYDSSARPQPVLATLPTQDAASWKNLDNGFRYRVYGDQTLRKMILRAKKGGRGKLLAHGDSTTKTPVLPFVAPVTVQLQEGNGACWESDFTTPLRSDAHVFRVE